MNAFRVGVRAFPPFESAIRKQWQIFESRVRSGLQLEAVPLDLHPLHASIFGPAAEPWDVVFVVTDWMAEAASSNTLLDLSPHLAPHLTKDKPEGYPDGW